MQTSLLKSPHGFLAGEATVAFTTEGFTTGAFATVAFLGRSSAAAACCLGKAAGAFIGKLKECNGLRRGLKSRRGFWASTEGIKRVDSFH